MMAMKRKMIALKMHFWPLRCPDIVSLVSNQRFFVQLAKIFWEFGFSNSGHSKTFFLFFENFSLDIYIPSKDSATLSKVVGAP